MQYYIYKKKNIILKLLFLCFSFSLLAQNNTDTLKTINGTITHLNTPIPNVNIVIKGTSKGTKTNTKGEYSLQANVGKIIEYSHVRYKTISVMIEDVTSTLNIELKEKNNQLDEVLVTANKDKNLHEVMNINIKTPFGVINPLASGYAVHYLDNENMRRISSPSLEDALNGRFSRVQKAGDKLYIRSLAAKYNIDDIEYERPPALIFSDIIHLFIIKEKALVVIRTKNAPEEILKRKKAEAEKHHNQNYYTDDAIADTNNTSFSSNNLIKSISGKVTHLNTPIPNVNIVIQGTSKGTKTNAKGEYSLQAHVGTIIEYSHVSFKTVSVMIEDVTTTLNIELHEKVNELDEALVKTRINQKALKLEKKMNVELRTSFGIFNPKKSGHSIKYVSGKALSKGAPNIVYALNGKAPGLKRIGKKLFFRGERRREAIYIVDGIETERRSVLELNINNIEDIYTVPYKNLIIIRTVNSLDVISENKEAKAEVHKNQNYYSDDAIAASNETSVSSNQLKTSQPKYIITKDISGKVMYLDAPLPLVNISIVGKDIGTKTNTKGNYNIKANVGDIIQYSHLGFATVSVIVEDVTNILDIEMVLEENELDEVTVTANGKLGETLARAKKEEKAFSSSRGNLDPKRSGVAMSFLEGDNVNAMYESLGEALEGKMPGVRYDRNAKKVIVKPRSSINTPMFAIWDIDGVIYEDEPPMDLNNIREVRILKTLSGTNRYGSDGAGGVIVVQTINGDFNPVADQRKKLTEQYTNKNFYSNDAALVSLDNLETNAYAAALEAFDSKQKAFIYYDQKLKKTLNNHSDHIAIAQKFVSHFKDITLASQIFKDLTIKHNKNPEVLKAVAYHLQALGLKKEAIKTYENTYKLRPKYAQSYRDLANAYLENDQYKKAWRLYMSYLMQGNDVSGEGIGEMVYNEMEFLYYNRRNQTQIKEKFVPKSDNLFDFRNDVRIVVEWNSSEAEFDLEFVNPEKRSYVFEHSLAANQDLITDEKEKGYSSKEFIIDDIGSGEWLVNISYKGNKKPEPTYFKITKYYQWGKTNQTREIDIYKFQNERNKIQLMQLNKQLLVSSK